MQTHFMPTNNVSPYISERYRAHPEAMFFRVEDPTNTDLFDSLYHSSARYVILWDRTGRTWYARVALSPFDVRRRVRDGKFVELNIPTCDTGNDTHTELGAEQARTVITALARMGQLLAKNPEAGVNTSFRFSVLGDSL